MLKVEKLQVNYGGIQAVRDVSFEVPEGKIITGSHLHHPYGLHDERSE